MKFGTLVTIIVSLWIVNPSWADSTAAESDELEFVEVDLGTPQVSSFDMNDFLREKNQILNQKPVTSNPKPLPAPGNTQGLNNQGCPQYFNNVECQVLKITNRYRAQYGLQALEGSPACYKVAKQHSQNMQAQGFFDHRDFSQRIRSQGLSGGSENIAKGYTNAEQVVTGWMNSSGHRKNILDPRAKSLGVGQVGVLWTQCFSY